jgi:RHS repeat-associated protein
METHAFVKTVIPIYDGSGNAVDEYVQVTDTRTSRNIYFGGRLIQSNGQTVVTDRLGSVRVTEADAGAGYYPYGEQQSGTLGNGREKFGTYTRELGSGLDYANQRYYASVFGRFNSPDPSNANVEYPNPLSLNLYSYVNGDPANMNDPTGLGIWGDIWKAITGGSGSSASGTNTSTPSGGGGAANSAASDEGVGDGGAEGAPTFSVTTYAYSQAYSGILTGSYTWNLSAAGAAAGAWFGPGGAGLGWVLGSMCGVGLSGSWVPSTNTLYVGVLGTCGLGFNAGQGVTFSMINVPAIQNPNSIANGMSRSAAFQPTRFTGSTATVSPGSGPPVTGFGIGTRVPVSVSEGFNVCVVNYIVGGGNRGK